jgi:Putative polyhydroxyalkanoic acid system protein (PHA_gran_rgn)
MLQYADVYQDGASEAHTMHIEQAHTLGRQEAMSRIDQFLDRLVQAPPGGVTIKDARKDWDGNRMTFSFTAAKGPFGTSVRGLMDVMDDRVVVESELPRLVKSLLGEDRIQHAISNGLEDMLRE